MKGLLPRRRPHCTLSYLEFLMWKANYTNRKARVLRPGPGPEQHVAGEAEQYHLGPAAFLTHDKGYSRCPFRSPGDLVGTELS